MTRRVIPVIVAGLVAALVACSDDGSSAPDATTESTTASETTIASSTAPATSTVAPSTAAPSSTAPSSTVAVTSAPPTTTAPVPASVAALVELLSDDRFAGRDNETPGSDAVRDELVPILAEFAEPLPGVDGYEHDFAGGTNLVAVVPGRDQADEYVVVGAHYDHLSVGSAGCEATPDDDVCNGAADNATGTAAAIEIGRRIAASGTNQRSVVIALFDAEEDGLLGSQAFVDDEVVEPDAIVAMMNLDILGTALLPSLADVTFAFGAETGGADLRTLVVDRFTAAGLEPVALSLVFGQDRSDHGPFARASVPVVFVSDATNGCYHTVDDEFERLDLDKLDRQVDASAEVIEVLARGELTTVVGDVLLPVTYDDVVAVESLVDRAVDELEASAPEGGTIMSTLADQMSELVAGGPAAFDREALNTMVSGTRLLLDVLAEQPCRPS